MSMMPSSVVNPITADIIASQSQDYVDEGLAEFQDQILRLQGTVNIFISGIIPEQPLKLHLYYLVEIAGISG
jgi:hypothetical protein